MNLEVQSAEPPSGDQADKKPRAAKARARATKSRAKRARLATKPKRTTAPAVRRGSKTAKILALLGRPGGASLAELKKATGWQAHSVRGFLSGAVKKKMGLRVASNKREDGERAYRIAAK
jgi:hypothetical protein